jgi:hypothetical protein
MTALGLVIGEPLQIDQHKDIVANVNKDIRLCAYADTPRAVIITAADGTDDARG